MFRKPRNKTSRPKRPLPVTVIAVALAVLFFARLYRAMAPLLEQQILRRGLSIPIYVNGSFTPEGWTLLTSALYLLAIIALVLVLIGFLRLRTWSWVVLMVWTGLSLALTLVQYFYGQPNYLVMASDVIIVLALNQSEVQKIYGIRPGAAQPL